jgi:hypothetical protein
MVCTQVWRAHNDHDGRVGHARATSVPGREHPGHQVGVGRAKRLQYNRAANAAGRCLAALIEKPPDAYGLSPALPHTTCPDVPPDARPFSPEAATPHADLGLPTGRDVVTVPIAVLPKRDPTACVSQLQIVANRRA